MTRLTMQLAESARLMIGKSFFLHDPAGIGASPAALDSCLEVRLSDGSLLARDRMKIDGEAWKAGLPGCWGDWSYHGLLLVMEARFPATFCAPRCALLPPRSMEFTPALRPCLTRKGTFARFLARDAVQLKNAMTTGWIAAADAAQRGRAAAAAQIASLILAGLWPMLLRSPGFGN